jgi:hypothetical protein
MFDIYKKNHNQFNQIMNQINKKYKKIKHNQI